MRKVGPEAVGLGAGHGGLTPGSAITVQMMQLWAKFRGAEAQVRPSHRARVAGKQVAPRFQRPAVNGEHDVRQGVHASGRRHP